MGKSFDVKDFCKCFNIIDYDDVKIEGNFIFFDNIPYDLDKYLETYVLWQKANYKEPSNANVKEGVDLNVIEKAVNKSEKEATIKKLEQIQEVILKKEELNRQAAKAVNDAPKVGMSQIKTSFSDKFLLSKDMTHIETTDKVATHKGARVEITDLCSFIDKYYFNDNKSHTYVTIVSLGYIQAVNANKVYENFELEKIIPVFFQYNCTPNYILNPTELNSLKERIELCKIQNIDLLWTKNISYNSDIAIGKLSEDKVYQPKQTAYQTLDPKQIVIPNDRAVLFNKLQDELAEAKKLNDEYYKLQVEHKRIKEAHDMQKQVNMAILSKYDDAVKANESLKLQLATVRDASVKFADVSAKTVIESSQTISNLGEVIIKQAVSLQKEKETSISYLLKNDAKNALYRIGATQLINAMRASIVTLLQTRNTDNNTLKVITDLLDSELGVAILSCLCGYFINYMNNDNEIIEKLGTELRVQGITVAGNVAFESLFSVVSGSVAELFSNVEKAAENDMIKEERVEGKKPLLQLAQ